MGSFLCTGNEPSGSLKAGCFNQSHNCQLLKVNLELVINGINFCEIHPVCGISLLNLTYMWLTAAHISILINCINVYHIYISQIETILDTVSALIVEVKLALEQIILAHSPLEGCRSQKGNMGEVLGKSLRNVSYCKCNKSSMHCTVILQ
jgi:hypothetical protein